MTTILAPSLTLREWDNNGNPLAGGRVFTYAAGTTTPQATFTDSTGGTPNANPVILNSRGEAQVWLTPNLAYKFLIQDSAGNQIRLVDQVTNSQLLSLFGGVDTGAANAYILNFTAAFSSLTNGIVIEWIPANTNTGASTISVNGLAISPLVNPDGTALLAGQIVAGQPSLISFYNGNWLLLVPVGTVRFGVAGANGVFGWGTLAAAYVDMSPDKGSWTTTFSGPWSAGSNPTGTLKFEKQGTQVTVWADASISQTSTGGGAITASGLPASITPSSPRNVISAQVINGSAGITNNLGSITVNTNSTISITPVFTANANNPTGVNCAGVFATTNAAGIGAGWSITYSV